MNEQAREALVQAALRGVTQIQGMLHGEDGEDCAMGVIHRDAHEHCGENPLQCEYGNPYKCAQSWGGIDEQELWGIINANDRDGWDFLTIARKIGNDEAPKGPVS